MLMRPAYFLLAPLTPFLGWGPVTHIYLHKKAMDELKGPGPAGAIQTDRDRELFISSGNATDLIKANQLRYKERYYEYAHNTIPTKFEGAPVFGEHLWTENLRLGRRDGIIYSLGWICHQVSDQFPHRYPSDGYEGFANARKFFGGFYPADDTDNSKPVMRYRNDLVLADHWLIEMFADLLCFSEEPDFFRTCEINLDFGDYPEIEALSAEILDKYRDALYPAVQYFKPLKPRVLKRVYRYYHTVIRAFIDMYFHYLDSLGSEKLHRLISEYTPIKDLRGMLDLSREAIRDAFEKPVGSWNPEKYKTPDPGPLKYSVYSYEDYDGPERYDFGFRRGVIPWLSALFLNNQLLNEIARKISDKVSLWPVIKPVLDVAANRRRSGMNITAFFLREMDGTKEPTIDAIIEKTAHRFKLKRKDG
jgi:hypothetical protein